MAACEHKYILSQPCGVEVCCLCGNHKGLERCQCTWSVSGGDGLMELIDLGIPINDHELVKYIAY